MSTEQKPHETEHKPLRRDCCLDDYSVLLGGKKIRSEHFLLEFVQLRKYILKFFLKRTFKKENEINTRNALCGEKCLLTLILCSDLKCVRNDMRAAAVYVCSSSILSLQFTDRTYCFFPPLATLKTLTHYCRCLVTLTGLVQTKTLLCVIKLNLCFCFSYLDICCC